MPTRRLSPLLGLLLLLFAPPTQATQSFVEVTEGAGKKLATETRTQGGNTVHDEYMILHPSTHTPLTPAHTDVAVTDTALAIFTSTVCRFARVKADQDNSTYVVVGPSTVTVANGFRLYPGDDVTLEPADGENCNTLYVNGTSGDGVSGIAK